MSIKIKRTYSLTRESIKDIIKIKITLKSLEIDPNSNITKTKLISKTLNSFLNVINLKKIITSIKFLIIDLKLNLINFFQRLIL